MCRITRGARAILGHRSGQEAREMAHLGWVISEPVWILTRLHHCLWFTSRFLIIETKVMLVLTCICHIWNRKPIGVGSITRWWWVLGIAGMLIQVGLEAAKEGIHKDSLLLGHQRFRGICGPQFSSNLLQENPLTSSTEWEFGTWLCLESFLIRLKAPRWSKIDL